MSNPKNPNDPDSLSLAPSGGDKKADFSNVQSGSGSTEADAPKADFSNVQSGSGSTEESIGEQTYPVQRGDTLSRSEERRVGTEGVRTWCFRWLAYHYKKNNNKINHRANKK